MNFQAGPRRGHGRGRLKYCWWKGKTGIRKNEEGKPGWRKWRWKDNPENIYHHQLQHDYKIALQLCKDLCLGTRAYEDSQAELPHLLPSWTWKSLCCSTEDPVSLSAQSVRSPQHLPKGSESFIHRSAVPLETPSATFLLESEQTLLNIHQWVASPSTTGQNQDIQRRKWRHWAKFPIEAPNWTSGNYSARPWVNQITFPVLWTCLNTVFVSIWL